MKFNDVFFKIGAGIVFFALCTYSYNVTKAYYEQKKRAETFTQTITDMQQEVSRYKVALNDSVSVFAARVNVLNMTVDNLKAKNGKLLNDLNIKPKNVSKMSSVTTSTKDTIRVPMYTDSFNGLRADYSDDFTKIAVSVNNKKECLIDYLVTDSIVLVNEQKKHSILFGLFKWYENEKTTVISKNPKTTVQNVETINIVK